ncbi:hypothetical protein Q4485_10090 [Granulosicoccaceae sp. 1_MG-2023]|nr:hypothetical protein [Granulosicoccaceae sp. 1_MG-2023]
MSLVCLFPLVASAGSYDSRLTLPSPWESWYTLSSAHFDVHYPDGTEDYARRLLGIAEARYDTLTRVMDNVPRQRTHIILNDSVDYSNGGATAYPYNQFYVYLNEPDEGELVSHEDFVTLLFTHEYTHILHQDQVAGVPALLRRVFGKAPPGLLMLLSMPQLLGPHWVAEGIAVLNESAGGNGRLQGAYYHAVMREELRAGLRSYTEVSYEGYYASRWPGGLVYVYGGWFFRFLEETYGREAAYRYITEYGSNLIPWQMNDRARAISGLNGPQLWARYSDWLQQHFAKQIDSIAGAGPTTAATRFDGALAAEQLSGGPDGSVFFVSRDLTNTAALMQAWPDGRLRTVARQNDISSLDWHPQSGLLISRTVVCENERLATDLFVMQPDDGRQTRLTHCARLPRAVWSADGQLIYAVQTGEGRNRLIKLDKTGNQFVQSELGAGEALGRPAPSPDGQWLVAPVKRAGSGWNLERFSLRKKRWEKLTDDLRIPSYPFYSADGQALYFILENSQQAELHRLNLADNSLERLTNSNGLVKQAALSGGALWFIDYTAQGERVRQVLRETPYPPLPVLREALPAPLPPPSQAQARPYSPWPSLRARGWTPVFSVSDELSMLGLSVQGSDALDFHSWSLTPAWFHTDDWNKAGGTAAYSLWRRFSLVYREDWQSLYDDGEVEAVEGNRALQAMLNFPLSGTEQHLRFGLGLASLRVEEQDLSGATLGVEKDALAGAVLSYNSLRKHARAITSDTGLALEAIAETYDAFGHSDASGNAYLGSVQGNLRFGRNQTLSLTVQGGHSGAEDRPFRLGGSTGATNDVSGITPLGQRRFNFRGYAQSSDLSGSNMALANMAWYFPLADIYNGWHILPLGLGRLSGNLFAEAGDAWDGASDRDWRASVGAEVSAGLLLGYDNALLPLSVGLAHGLADSGETQAYLRLSLTY